MGDVVVTRVIGCLLTVGIITGGGKVIYIGFVDECRKI